MNTHDLENPIFTDKDAAREHCECQHKHSPATAPSAL